MRLWLAVMGCLPSLSAGDWERGHRPEEETSDTGVLGDTGTLPPTVRTPPEVSLESIAIGGWLGPAKRSHFGTAAVVYSGGSRLLVTSPHENAPSEVYLLGLDTAPQPGDLEASLAQVSLGSIMDCGRLSSLGALEEGDALSVAALGCDNPGVVYLLSGPELLGAVGPVELGALLQTSTFQGDPESQFGASLTTGDSLPEPGFEVAIGAPNPQSLGAVYLLSSALVPGEHALDEALLALEGAAVGDLFGKGLDHGLDAAGDPFLAVTAPNAGAGLAYVLPLGEDTPLSADDVVPAFALHNGDNLVAGIGVADIDGDGTEDLLLQGRASWYGVVLASLGAAEGSCNGAAWCIATDGSPSHLEEGQFDAGDEPDLALSAAPLNQPGRVELFFEAPSLGGLVQESDADLVLVSLGEGTGSALCSVRHTDYDRLLVGESGLDLAGAEDIGGAFLIDLQLALLP